MKAGNMYYRAYKKNPDAVPSPILSPAIVEKIKAWTPPYPYVKSPFEPYQLQNNLANIKRMRGRVKELEAKANADTTTTDYGAFQVVRNIEADRLQIIFDGKPADDIRAVLKSNGFRWSPRNGAWQRKLTNNALYAVRMYVLKSEAFKTLAA